MKTVLYRVNKKKSNRQQTDRQWKPREDISSSGFRPVELKRKQTNGLTGRAINIGKQHQGVWL